MIRAIVVDDEDVIRDSLREFIDWNRLGIHSVSCASDGLEAITLSRQIKPDIIISDIRMPRLSGIAFVEELRNLLPNCKIIFISGYSDKEYLKSAIQLKAISFVEKPINLCEITAAVQKAVEEVRNESLLGTLMHKNRVLCQELAIQLCNPVQQLESVTRRLMNVDHNFLACNLYCTLIFRFAIYQLPQDYTSMDNERLILLQSVFDSYFQGCLTVPVDNSRIIMHISDPCTTNEEVFKKSISNCMAEFRLNLNPSVKVFTAVGISVTGLNNIHLSYGTALTAEQQLFYTGFDTLVFYQSKLLSKDYYVYDHQLASTFDSALRQGNKQLAFQLTSLITASIQQRPNTHVDYVKNIFFKLSQKLSDIAFERGMNQSDNQEDFRKYLWKLISEKETLNDLYNEFQERLTSYFNCLSSIAGNKSVSEITQYIQKHFSCSDLSIGKISDAVHLTESHICHIFKQATGKTLNQFITEYRIDKAKELLRNKQAKLVEIADAVGYTDANYFTRTFKKLVGITPSEYRDRYLL